MTHQNQKPNILFIMSDQHRHDFLGAAGADFITTPNLDRLAQSGVRFTQCTTNCPVCAPARIGLATGLQPTRLGSLDNHSFLPSSVPTYYQRLRDHGYRVGCVGKLDLAKPDRYNGRHGDRPCVYGWGFTHPLECEGKMHAGTSPTPLGPYGFSLQEQGLYECFHEDYVRRRSSGWIKDALHDSVLPTEAFEDVYIGREAVKWIENVAEDFPWHLFVSFVGPHDPFDPPTEYADRYRNALMPKGIADSMEDKPDWIRRRMAGLDAEEVAVSRRQYCASTEVIDAQIGALVEALERRGMADNTIIVYASDHGEMLGDHGLYTKGVAYEGALRVPLIVAGPGIAGGRVCDGLVELIDVNPTVCELAGLPVQGNIDALSFRPVLDGQCAGHRKETVSAIRNLRCIRTHTHKLIDNYGGGPELYDLREDPQELRNIHGEEQELANRLYRQMAARFVEDKWRR